MFVHSFLYLAAIMPMIAVTYFNYRRWRARYGPDVNLISYYLRYLTARKDTEDPTILYIAKAVLCVVWAVVVINFIQVL